MGSVRLPLSRWLSFLALVVASVLLRFSLGPQLIPAFTWLFPVFMMMWVRSNKAGWGLLLGWILTILALAMIALPAAGVWGGTLICWMIAGIAGSLLFLPFAVDRFVSHRLSGIVSTLVFPLAWVSVEFLRSFHPYFGTTFALAVTQFDSPLITQISSVTGIWAITFLMVWLAPVVCLALEHGFEWPSVARPVSLFLLVLVVVLCFGGIRLGLDQPASPTVRVAGVTASSRNGTLESGVSLLSTTVPQAAAAGARIVTTHEGGVLVAAEDESALIGAGQALAQQEGVYLSLGLQVENEERSPPYENKTVFISPDGELLAEYTKQRLAPAEEANTIRGEGPVPVVETPYGSIATIICNDAVFPDFVRRKVGGRDVDILLVPAWDFRYVEHVWSHFMAFRAIENGFSMFRLAREGLTLAVDHLGRPLLQSNYFLNDQAIVYADLPTEGRSTVYSLLGDWFAWLSIAGFVVLLLVAITVNSGQASPSPKRALRAPLPPGEGRKR
jgi:apolipoprotein N-acyltransferase